MSETDFDALKRLGHIASRAEQLNVYYDAAWKLADSSTTLRIRFKDGADPVLSLKIPVSHSGSRRVMQEIELTLPKGCPALLPSRHPMRIDVDRQLPDDFCEYLRQLGVKHLERVGWVRNTRYVLEIEDIGSIELDRLELPDGSVVHEAEIESDNDWTHRSLADFVCQYAPQARPSAVSKFQRFRRAAVTA
ncbi:MAG: CYTH domain-containing protein [Gemmatimonadaceae bacterium]